MGRGISLGSPAGTRVRGAGQRSGMWAFRRESSSASPTAQATFCLGKGSQLSPEDPVTVHGISQQFKHRRFPVRSFLSSQDSPVPTFVTCHSSFIQQIFSEQLLCARHCSRNRSAQHKADEGSLLERAFLAGNADSCRKTNE